MNRRRHSSECGVRRRFLHALRELTAPGAQRTDFVAFLTCGLGSDTAYYTPSILPHGVSFFVRSGRVQRSEIPLVERRGRWGGRADPTIQTEGGTMGVYQRRVSDVTGSVFRTLVVEQNVTSVVHCGHKGNKGGGMRINWQRELRQSVSVPRC